ncbi:MAG TPA: cation transporter, partial [Sulfolobales archaeon]|nr:cation transporter [Sulfolobales archaeon]
MREEVYRIIGMHCATCAITIQKSLSKLGIEALVSLASEEARIRYDPSKVKPRDIVNAIRKAGYDVYKEEAIAIVKNLNSYDDEKIIVERLRNLEGVIEVHASHIDKSVRILYNPLVIKQQSLAEALGSLGYNVESFKAEAEVEDIGSKVATEDLKKLRLYTLISLPASILLAIYYMLGYMGYPVPLWGSPLLRDLLVG